jgi:integrase
VETCKSKATKKVYVKALHYFMGYLRLSPQAYDKLLPPERDTKSIQMDICNFITYIKKQHSSATVTLYVAAINKFYAMNDVTTLNWKKIHSFEGERDKQTEDRPYTHSEIRMLTTNASIRDRSIFLLMSSAGLRVGAVAELRVKDLEPIDKYQLFKINIYANSKKHEYFSFCTPECRNAIEQYLDYLDRWGEKITDDSHLFRADYNASGSSRKGTGTERRRRINPITVKAMSRAVEVLLKNTGLRQQVPLATETETIQGKQHRRSHIMMTHGFRKFFETNAFKAGMDHMYIRRLMGQKSGLEDSYLKLSEEELLEGDSKHVGYIGIIDQLTIDDSNRLRRENETLRVSKSEMESFRNELEELKKLIGM